MSEKRTFAIKSAEFKLPENYQGRFESKTPRGAAVKAARQLFKLAPKKQELRFVLRESTLGSIEKEFHYTGIKRKLEEPKVIERNGKQITIQYEYTVRACM